MAYKRQEIIDMVEQMPAFPQSVHRVMELTSDINSDPKELLEVIEHDPVLILKILKLVNSPYFGLAQKITSVNHAMIYIGLNTIKNIALSIATIGVLPAKNSAGFDTDAFLLHSLSTATIARLFARKLGVPQKEISDYFVSGLLHDIGKVVFVYSSPHEFRRAMDMAMEMNIPLHKAESEIFDIDHAGIGGLLGEKWLLPSNLVEPLKYHHSYETNSTLIISVVAAANQISNELNIGHGGDPVPEKLPVEITGRFGEKVSAIIEQLGNVTEEIEKSKAFIQL
jgi:HD-like signal output (HDOD) protein